MSQKNDKEIGILPLLLQIQEQNKTILEELAEIKVSIQGEPNDSKQVVDEATDKQIDEKPLHWGDPNLRRLFDDLAEETKGLLKEGVDWKSIVNTRIPVLNVPKIPTLKR